MPADTEDGQRKLAAILAADVAGYSRLMADDERATVTALKEARAVFKTKVEGRQGRLIDTAGDSVLAEFRSVVEAVQCAVEVQAEIKALNEPVEDRRRMYFRIGVNLGDVIEEADGTIYGDGVNIAARLEALAEPGGVNVSGKVYDEVKGKLEDVNFGFLGEQEVKNIPEPVRAYRVLADGEAADTAAEPRGHSKAFLRSPIVVAGLVATLAIAIGIAVWGLTLRVEVPRMVKADGTPTNDPVLAIPQGPSIAVMPFENVGGDTEQDAFAHGLTLDVIGALSRFNELFVFGRETTATLAHQKASVKVIGAELGADYVLNGSVRRNEESVRISTRLSLAESGKQIWFETYDRSLAANTVFEIQDDIVGRVVGTLGSAGGVLSRAENEIARHKPPEQIESYDCVAMERAFWDIYTPEWHKKARDCLERVVSNEPNYAEAWASLASMYSEEFMSSFNELPNARERALDAAERAVALAPTSPSVRSTLAHTYYYIGEDKKFLVEIERAISLNPYDSDILGAAGHRLIQGGHIERGKPLIAKAKILNPLHAPWVYWADLNVALLEGHYEEALSAAEKSCVPDNFYCYLTLATANGHLGRAEAADQAVDELLHLFPGFDMTIAEHIARLWVHHDPLVQQYLVGMRKAGVPEAYIEPPSRPTIAVLPFSNMSDDPDQLYFAHGITEDIITRLAQFPDLLVLGRNTTFQFDGQAVDIPTIADKLGADYIVEGSIRRSGDTVRVKAQLLGGEEWTHLWAETYDRALNPTNLFEVQDEITEAVASRIGDAYGVISAVEFQRSSRQAPKKFSSYDCILRVFEYGRSLSEENHRVARDCLEEVVVAEPDYGDAIAYLAGTYLVEVTFGFNASAESSLRRGLQVAEQAVAIDSGSATTRVTLADALFLNDEPERAIREAEEALRLDPNNVDIIAMASEVFANTGAYERAEDMIARAAILNPNFPLWMHWKMALVHMARGESSDVITRLEMSQMDWYHWTHTAIAASHCASGDIEKGQKKLDVALQMQPDLAEVYWAELYFWLKGPDVRPIFDYYATGLGACGWDVPPDPGREAFAPIQ